MSGFYKANIKIVCFNTYANYEKLKEGSMA